jgi:hypothetical protein
VSFGPSHCSHPDLERYCGSFRRDANCRDGWKRFGGEMKEKKGKGKREKERI